MLTGLNKNPEHCDVSLSLLKCYGRCWKSGNVREHFQCLMLFPCKFAKPGLQVVDGLIWCLPMPAARKEEWASWYYLGLEELDPSFPPSAKAKQTFRRRSSDYFLWWINPLDRLILVYFGPRPRTLSLSSWNKGFETPLLSLCWAESQRVFEPSAVCQFLFELSNLWRVPAGSNPVNKSL